MISGVGTSPTMRLAREPVEDFTVDGGVTYSKPLVSGSGGFKVLNQSAGRIAFDLNDGYSMWIDERRSAFTVADAAGKESVQVDGTAQLALNGNALGGFAGTTSLVLLNGTKITMETLAEAKSADVFHLDRLTVTRGDSAVVVSGVSQMTGGDLKVTQSRTGDSIDGDTRDGLVLIQTAPAAEVPVPVPVPVPVLVPITPPLTVEPALLPPVTAEPVPPQPLTPAPLPTNTLIGWATEAGIPVTPEMLRATLAGGEFGPGSNLLSLEEFQALIMRFLSWGAISSLMSWSSQTLNSELRRQEPSDVARAADVRRAWARHADETAAATRGSIRSAEKRVLEMSG
jgi:Domain of Unknown Function (DUF1521)